MAPLRAPFFHARIGTSTASNDLPPKKNMVTPADCSHPAGCLCFMQVAVYSSNTFVLHHPQTGETLEISQLYIPGGGAGLPGNADAGALQIASFVRPRQKQQQKHHQHHQQQQGASQSAENKPSQSSDGEEDGADARDSQPTSLSSPQYSFEEEGEEEGEEGEEEADEEGDNERTKRAAGLQMQDASAELAVQRMGATDEGQSDVVEKERLASGRKELVTEHRTKEPGAEGVMATATDGYVAKNPREAMSTRLGFMAEWDDGKARVITEAGELVEVPEVSKAGPVLPSAPLAAAPEEDAIDWVHSQEAQEAAEELLPSSTEGQRETEGGDIPQLRRQSGGGSARSTALGLAARKTIIVTKEVRRNGVNMAVRKERLLHMFWCCRCSGTRAF